MVKILKELSESKRDKRDIETRIVKRTVHSLQYKDQFGRWMNHSEHESNEKAQKKIPILKREVRQDEKADWSGYTEKGRVIV